MKLFKWIILSLLICPDLKAAEIIHDSKTDLKMGRGYNSSTENFGQFCLEPVWKIDGSSSATVKVLSSISQDSLARELGFGAMGRYKTGATTTTAKAEFLQTSQSNGFSISYTFKSNYEFPPRGMTEYTWTEQAKAQLKPVPREDGYVPSSTDDANTWKGKVMPLNPDEFYKKCGNEVITTQTLGAKFFFTIKVVFSNKKDFEKFTANFDLSSPSVDIEADFKQQMEKMSSRTDVIVNALQIGGQVDKLTGIFKGNSKHFVQCSAGKLENCYDVLAAAVEYATDTRPLSEGGQGFPAQIDPNIAPGQYAGPAVLSSITQPYDLITNFQEPSEQLQMLSKEMRKDLNKLFDQIFADWTFAMQIRRTGLPRLNPEQTAIRNQIEAEAMTDLMEIADAIEGCFNDISACPERYKEISPSQIGNEDIGRIKMSDGSDFVGYAQILDFEAKTFAALCDKHKARMLTRELDHTVAELIKYADSCETHPDTQVKTCVLEEAHDECGSAESIIASHEKIDLSSRGIVDLTPLLWFPDITHLNLSGNKLKDGDLKPLLKLSKLEFLELGKNFLSEVGEIKTMTQLVELRLNGNQIEDIKELSNLTNLKLLDASSNKGRLECPLLQPEYCILVDFSRQTSFATAPSVNGVERIGASIIDLNDQYLALLGGPEGSPAELVDKNNMNHIKLNLTMNRRVGATFARISDYEVIASGGMGQENLVIKYYIDFKTMSMTSEIIEEMNRSEFNQESVVLLDGRILIVGGYMTNDFTENVVSNTAYIYSPSTGVYERLKSGMREPRTKHKLIRASNGLVYIFGGNTYNPSHGETPSNTIEVFDPKTNQFRMVGERMFHRRSGHTATLIDENTVLIAGGFTENVPGSLYHLVTPDDEKNIEASRTAELFYINSESLYELPRSLVASRANHQAILLSDGKVLLVGGQRNPANFSFETESCGVCEKSAEIFDPSKEIFISTGNSMSYGRVHFVLATLPDNRVYINGGIGQGASWYSELFSYSNLD